jgi:hypothetical protein
MSMGTGAAYLTSKKQKLNTKSSTEAEPVGVEDMLPQALWTKYFMEAQGYGVSTVLNQDNQSTIKLSENGKASSGRGSRHINIRFFLLPTGSLKKKWGFSIVPPRKWWLTTPLNHYRGNFSTSSEIKSWVWFQWIPSLETTGVC